MKSLIFISFLFLSCQAQDDEEPSLREALIGKWNSVEHGTEKEVHKEATGSLNNTYASGFLLNSDGSYILFIDSDNDGENETEFNLSKSWNVDEGQLVFINLKNGSIHSRYEIKSVSEDELVLILPAIPGGIEDYYIKFVRQ